MERVGIFGGSFSPPHAGHLRSAEIFIREMSLDKLIVVPACISPGKKTDGLATPEDRYRMCCLTFSALPRAEVSDTEIVRGGISYTVDTLRHFAAEGRQLFWLCGTDVALTLHLWREPAELFRLCDFVCIRREKDSDITGRLEQQNRYYLRTFGKAVRIIETEPLPMSSTEVRLRIATERHFHGMISADTMEYIISHDLYKPPDPALVTLRAQVQMHVSPSRFEHILGVEREITWLGSFLMPESMRKLRTAALLHDITKGTPDRDQPLLCGALDIRLTSEDLSCTPVLHALSSAAIARRDFGDMADEQVIRAIELHTTGSPDMTLFDRLLFMADYTEAGRTHPQCREIRRLMHKMDVTLPLAQRIEYFEETFRTALARKWEYLQSTGQPADPRTEAAYRRFCLFK